MPSDIIVQIVQQSALSIPIQIIAGAPGPEGPQGPAGTITIGSVVTGPPNSNVSIGNSGTPSAAILNFSIPRGAVGEPGPQGLAATLNLGTVTTGAPGSDVSITNSGTSSAAVFNFTIPRGDTGLKGDVGDQGPSGTLSIGTVTTGAPGSSASVSNVGTPSAAILNFSIPRGDTGQQGPAGTVSVGTTTTGAAGSSANVSNSGTPTAAILNFTLPRGDAGEPGAAGVAATISLGTVNTGAAGSDVSITNSGTSSAAVFNFTIPRGSPGDPGTPATISIGTTTTGASGSNASVTNSGTASAAVLNFTIPRGLPGDPGTPGAAATISIGTTTTGAAGSDASVTNSGTSSAAVFNFTIPRGAAGDPGQSSTISIGTTTTGDSGTNAAVTNSGTSSAAVLNFTIPRGLQGDPGPQGPPGGSGGGITQSVVTNFTTGQEVTVTGLELSSNKWFASIIEEWDNVQADPLFTSVGLLIRANGTDGNTLIPNEITGGTDLTGAGCTISTTQSKYGGSSLQLASGGSLLFPVNTNTTFGTGNFTMEFWMYATSLLSDLRFIRGGGANQWSFGSRFTTFRTIGFVQEGVAWNNEVAWTPLLNQWVHIAVCRSGTTVRYFQNGALIGTATQGASFNMNAPAISTPSASNAWYDDVRVTKAARYTAAFTPPLEVSPTGVLVAYKYVANIGGLNDTGVDYGIEKISNTSLKVKKMSATTPDGTIPIPSTVDRVYINIIEYGAMPIPAGGTAGQTLTKVDATDYNYIWATPSGGGGQVLQLYASVRNAESIQINKGQPVYLYQATGDHASVKLAVNTSDATSAKTLGLAAEDIAAGAIGSVICQGELIGVDTSAFAEGDPLYLGVTAGTLTATKPAAPNHMVAIGVVEKANAGAGQIYVRVQNGFELEELHNVLITSPTNDQVLTYETATGLWKNKTLSGGGGITNEQSVINALIFG